jgi:hypothetical protein
MKSDPRLLAEEHPDRDPHPPRHSRSIWYVKGIGTDRYACRKVPSDPDVISGENKVRSVIDVEVLDLRGACRVERHVCCRDPYRTVAQALGVGTMA